MIAPVAQVAGDPVGIGSIASKVNSSIELWAHRIDHRQYLSNIQGLGHDRKNIGFFFYSM